MTARRIAAAAAALALGACGGDGITRATRVPPPPAPPTPAAYVVEPPAGKLPWPQHDPRFTRAQHDSMMRELVFANNFALYQTGPTVESAYLHHGLDIATPDGTPIFAMESGTVRAVDDREGDYKMVLVEDEDEPGHGWLYAHIDSIRVSVGQVVAKGTRLSVTRFRAYPHLHLDRVHLTAGGSWGNLAALTTTQPDTFLAYDDTQAPVFEQGVYYFRNESDSLFARPSAGPPVVHGDVDIVAGIRDPGEHNHPRNRPDDRQAPTRIEYAITPLGQPVEGAPRRKSIDFRTLVLPRLPGRDHRLALAVFKDFRMFYPNGGFPALGRWAGFFVITNTPPEGRTGLMSVDDGAPSWRTAERDASGRPLWPDGDYVVTIWAWDFHGNVASRQDTVRVRNE